MTIPVLGFIEAGGGGAIEEETSGHTSFPYPAPKNVLYRSSERILISDQHKGLLLHHSRNVSAHLGTCLYSQSDPKWARSRGFERAQFPEGFGCALAGEGPTNGVRSCKHMRALAQVAQF